MENILEVIGLTFKNEMFQGALLGFCVGVILTSIFKDKEYKGFYNE